MAQSGFRIAAIGELLWDMLPDGPQLGGAPANFAAMCAHLAAVDSESQVDVFPVSRVGEDAPGQNALKQLSELRINLDHISQDAEHATGTVNVEFDSHGSPAYNILKDVAWDYIPETSELAGLASTLDAVCFGTLAQRSPVTRATLRAFVEQTRPGCAHIFDVNLRDPYWTPEMLAWGCAHATILKMNREEVPLVARALGIPDGTASMIANTLLRHFPVELVAVTRGADGSLLVARNEIHDHPGIAADVVDLVGAGDAFTAALTFSVLRRRPLAQVAEDANRWGAWAAAHRGGMPARTESASQRDEWKAQEEDHASSRSSTHVYRRKYF